MREPTNNDRAKHAERALIAFQEAKKEVIEMTEDEVVDLIADLLHFANIHLKTLYGTNPIDLLSSAKMHFELETMKAIKRKVK